MGTLWEPLLFKEEAKRAGSIRGAEMDEALAEVGWAAGMQRCGGRAGRGKQKIFMAAGDWEEPRRREAGARTGSSQGRSCPRAFLKSRES